MDAAQVEVVRALCDDLAAMEGVVYAAVERRGGATIGEGGDRGALLRGEIVSAMREELVAVGAGLVVRIVYDERADEAKVRSVAEWARTTLRRLLADRERPFPGTPTGTPPSGTSGAPAQIGVYDGARKRWTN